MLLGLGFPDERFEHVHQSENEFPLKDWSRFTREDQGDQVKLTYWPERRGYIGFAPPAVVVVERSENGFEVVSYGAAY